MGEVYLADDLTLERAVALKVLTGVDQTDPKAQARALREARAVAAIDHPNICTIYEVDTDDGRPFIAMSFVEGETLAARLERGPVAPQLALRIAEQIADSLAAAHERGIIHRDINPRNVMLTPKGDVKVLDFGLARSVPVDSSGSAATTSAGDTAGRVRGTAAYLSPEQIQEQDLDVRTDLFALGAVVYECLTGRRAFPGESPLKVCADIIHLEPLAPSEVAPSLTPVHDQLCAQLLAKDPQMRVQTAGEALRLLRLVSEATRAQNLAARLRGAPDERERRLEPPRRVSVWTVTAAGASGVLLLLVAYVAVQFIWAPALPPPPLDAQRLYDSGVAALHRGSYTTAATVLEEAVATHDQFPMAFARLAQARDGLDESGPAAGALNYAQTLLSDRSRFEPEELLHLDAIVGVVNRDLVSALGAYTALEAADPTRAEIQFELGHVYELDEQLDQALARYERAVELDPLYAPALVRQGVILGRQGDIDDALGSFERAERLYQAAADTEGRAEAIYQRGVLLHGARRLSEAATELERALVIAETGGLIEQQLRALGQLSMVSTRRGDVERGEERARRAVELAAGHSAFLASALLRLGHTFLAQGNVARTEPYFVEAEDLARSFGAERTRAEAQVALATVALARDDPRTAVVHANAARSFYETGGYQREAVRARLTLASGRMLSGELAEALALFERQVVAAESLDDPLLLADAHAGVGTALVRGGALRDALVEFDVSIELYEEVDDFGSLADSLSSAGLVLAHLGRGPEARLKLDSLSTRPDLEEFRTSLAGRISLVEADLALGLGDYQMALDHAVTALTVAGETDIRTAVQALAVSCVAAARGAASGARGHCEDARLRSRDSGDALLEVVSALASAEERLLARDYTSAESLIKDVLVGSMPGVHAHHRWRAALVGGRAAARAGRASNADNAEAVTRYATERDAALEEMRADFGPEGVTTYLARADVAALIQLAGQ